MNQAQPKLSLLNRGLCLWIFLAMALGLLLGLLFPGAVASFQTLSIGSTNIPLALGLIIMMYPPLAKVRYQALPAIMNRPRLLLLSLLLNWVIGPVLMFGLAWIFFKNEPAYFSGLVLIGLARCIAMVLVWNDLAGGSSSWGAGLVALNSLFQVFAYSLYAWVFLTLIPPMLGADSMQLKVPVSLVAQNVAIYLGIPFALGALSRPLWSRIKSPAWFEQKYLPFVAPFTLVALLFTVVWMFSLKSEVIFDLPIDVLRLALPLMLYFSLMFGISYSMGRWLKADYPENAAIAFTAAGNNFELAIAVSIALFGLNSPQAFVGVVGPLVEVPALILLVRLAKYLRSRHQPGSTLQSQGT